MNAIIETKDLSFSYEKNVPILEHVNMHIHQYESVGLIGANGVGKSTLMKVFVGLCRPFAGEVTVGGLPINDKTLDKVRALIGYVFQESDHQLFMSNVAEDVAFAPRNYGFSEEEVAERVNHALELVGIMHLKDRPIYKLSGGEKKLASIATILSMKPELMILDEPSTALDPRNRRQLIHILNDLPTAKIIATHDLDFVLDTCERTILMAHGTIVYDGRTEDIMQNRELLEENGLELPLRYQQSGS